MQWLEKDVKIGSSLLQFTQTCSCNFKSMNSYQGSSETGRIDHTNHVDENRTGGSEVWWFGQSQSWESLVTTWLHQRLKELDSSSKPGWSRETETLMIKSEASRHHKEVWPLAEAVLCSVWSSRKAEAPGGPRTVKGAQVPPVELGQLLEVLYWLYERTN